MIYKNLIIVSSATGYLPMPGRPGDPHAYDLRTGGAGVAEPGWCPIREQPGADGWKGP